MSIKITDETTTKDFTAEMEKLLLGHKITKVERDYNTATLTLEDGTVLEAVGNDGCGGCANGFYDITELNGCDNVITRVEASVTPEAFGHPEDTFDVFVFAEDKKIHALGFGGCDNGFYGTGFTLTVKRPEH